MPFGEPALLERRFSSIGKPLPYFGIQFLLGVDTPGGNIRLALRQLDADFLAGQLVPGSQRQRKGIAIAKAQGRYTGRKSIDVPDLEKVVRLWREGWMTAVEAMRRLELSPSTFYRKVKQVR